MRLFVQGSHHRSITTMYLVQNLFDKSKEHRTISLNAQYMVIYKNPRDSAQIEFLGRQMYPNDKGFLAQAFADATNRSPYSYLLLDLRPETPNYMRVKTNVVQQNPHEPNVQPRIVYVPFSEQENVPPNI
jgi:hypothetical protein